MFLLLTASLCLPVEQPPAGWTPPPMVGNTMTGFLSQYDETPTIYTIDHQQKAGLLPFDMSNYDGVVAVESCDLVGREGWLTAEGRTLRVIVFDCSGDIETSYWMWEDNIIAEVGYYLAKEMGIIGRGGIAGTLVLE